MSDFIITQCSSPTLRRAYQALARISKDQAVPIDAALNAIRNEKGGAVDPPGFLDLLVRSGVVQECTNPTGYRAIIQ